MEADKTVSAEIAVSDLTTAFQSQLVPMPICRYDVLDGGPTGEPVSFAQVGDQVYHKFTCDTETVDTFCMVVHSCFVDDGNGDSVTIINDDGCALDRFVLNNLEYPTDLMAGQEAHVYKYADRSQLFYQCQITITIKEPGEECSRPQCEEPTGTIAAAGTLSNTSGTGASPASTRRPTSVSTPRPPARLRLLKRLRRQDSWKENAAGTMDVRTELNALDLLDEAGYTASLLNRPDIVTRRNRLGSSQEIIPRRTMIEESDSLVCLNKVYFNLGIFVILLIFFVATGISALLLLRSHRKL